MRDELIVVMKTVVKALVDEPEAVEVSTARGTHGEMILHVRVAPPDVGKLIGKKGRTARSLRTIVWALSAKERFDCTLNIHEYDRRDAA